MRNLTRLRQEIDAEYEEYQKNPEYDLDEFYSKLSEFVEGVIIRTVQWKNYVDKDVVGNLTQETLLAILEKGMGSYENKGAKFTTYCDVIAKNKAIDWIRKQRKSPMNLEEGMEQQSQHFQDRNIYGSPERLILKYEYQLEQIAMVKKYLKLLMDWPQKPYRTVSCGYTLVLFQKYHPHSKELSSPKWAYETLQKRSVEQGAEDFLTEMQGWLSDFSFLWGADFIRAMSEEENQVLIKDIIFGERFQVKDFENWSRRLQPKIKQRLLEECNRTDNMWSKEWEG